MAEFRNPPEMDRNVTIRILSQGTNEEICDALVSLALHDEDWKWSQDQCLFFLDHSAPDVRAVAASCLGHIARIHRQLDRDIVESSLEKHLSDENIAGNVQDALDDIQIFLGNKRESEDE